MYFILYHVSSLFWLLKYHVISVFFWLYDHIRIVNLWHFFRARTNCVLLRKKVDTQMWPYVIIPNHIQLLLYPKVQANTCTNQVPAKYLHTILVKFHAIHNNRIPKIDLFILLFLSWIKIHNWLGEWNCEIREIWT